MVKSNAVVVAIVIALVCVMFLWILTSEIVLINNGNSDQTLSYVDVATEYTDVSESMLTADQREQAAARVEEHIMPKCNDMLTGKTLVNACHEIDRKNTCGNFFQKRTDGFYYCDRVYDNGVSNCMPGNRVTCK